MVEGNKEKEGVDTSRDEAVDGENFAEQKSDMRKELERAEMVQDEGLVLNLEDDIRDVEDQERLRGLRGAISKAEKENNEQEVLQFESELHRIERGRQERAREKLERHTEDEKKGVEEQAQTGINKVTNAGGSREHVERARQAGEKLVKDAENVIQETKEEAGAGLIKTAAGVSGPSMAENVVDIEAARRRRSKLGTAGKPEMERPGEEEQLRGFRGKYSRGLFEKLGDGAKQFTEGLYIRAKFSTVDRLGILFNSKLINWHDRSALKHADKIQQYGVEIGQINRQLGSMKMLKQRFGIEHTDVSRLESVKERRKLAERLERLKEKKDKEQTKLKYRNNKKRVYENSRREISKGYVESIKEHTAPYEKKSAQLQEDKAEVDLELGNLIKTQESLEKRRQEIEEVLEDTFLMKSERPLVKEALKKVKAELKTSRKFILKRMGDRAKIEKDMIPGERKLDKWRDRANVAARISNRKVVYQEGDDKIVEGVRQGREEIKAGSASASGEATIGEEAVNESIEGDLEGMTSRQFTDSWNAYFGSEIYINARLLDKLMGNADPGQKLSHGDFESGINRYADTLKSQGYGKKKITRSNISRRLQSVWAYNKFK